MAATDLPARAVYHLSTRVKTTKKQRKLLLNNIIDSIKRIVRLYSDNQVSFLAGAISYFTFFSIFPLLLLFILIVGKVFGQSAVSGLLGFIDGQVPFVGALLSDNLAVIIQDRPAVSLVAAAGLIWGSIGIFYSIEFSLNKILSVEKRRDIFYTLISYFVTMFLISALFLLSLASSTIALNLGALLNIVNSGNASVPSKTLIFLVSIVFSIGASATAYRIIPDTRLPAKALLFGSLFTSVAFEALNLFFGYYIDLVDLSLTYGGLAPFATLLIWIYFAAVIFLIGALLARINT